MTIKHTQNANKIFLKKLEKHFEKHTFELIPENDLLGFSDVFKYKVYCCETEKLQIRDILSYQDFLKTDIYEFFIIGEAQTDSRDYLMALYCKGSNLVFIIQKIACDRFYTGTGAIVLNDYLGDQDAFIIVPLANFLQDKNLIKMV